MEKKSKYAEVLSFIFRQDVSYTGNTIDFKNLFTNDILFYIILLKK